MFIFRSSSLLQMSLSIMQQRDPSMLIPLESNPEAFNTYLSKLGLSRPKLQFTDVFGISPELLDMVPQPVAAILLVYPITSVTEQVMRQRSEQQRAEAARFCSKHGVYYTKQTITNMCGTVAILHAVLNNLHLIGKLKSSSCLSALRDSMAGQTAEQCARILETEQTLTEAHTDIAESENLNSSQEVNMSTSLHFVCFIHAGERCVELDGRLCGPVLHGACSTNKEFLNAVADVIAERMRLVPDSHEFSIMALAPMS